VFDFRVATCHLFETLNLDEIAKKIRDATTLGASVTIPHKLDVIPLVDKLTPHAKQIGKIHYL
jgi:pentafunctional AROM polypeptide